MLYNEKVEKIILTFIFQIWVAIDIKIYVGRKLLSESAC